MNDNQPICQCNIPANLQRDQMYEAIAGYVRNIPDELRVADEEYERRLKLCSECEALIGGLTCRYCGCFVLARARKENQGCPQPGNNRWYEAGMNEK